MTADEKGYAVYSGDGALSLELRDQNNRLLTGQVIHSSAEAKQILNIADLDASGLFVFPFSTVPIARNVYVMTDEDMEKDGITDKGEIPHPTAAVRSVVVSGGADIKNVTLPFGVTNLSHQKDISKAGGGSGEIATKDGENLLQTLDMNRMFENVDMNDMLKKGVVFISSTAFKIASCALNVAIIPTEDPSEFNIVISVLGDSRNKPVDMSQPQFASYPFVKDTMAALKDKKNDTKENTDKAKNSNAN